jgi:hypothetical protein
MHCVLVSPHAILLLLSRSHDTPCNNTVGCWNLYKDFPYKSSCAEGMPEDTCWAINTVNKLSADFPGAWYSTLAQGCATPTAPTPDCTWRVVSIDAIIESDCQKQQFLDAVAVYNKTCFDACPNPTCVTDGGRKGFSRGRRRPQMM